MNIVHIYHGEAAKLYERDFLLRLSTDEQLTASNMIVELDRITFITCRYFLKLLLSQALNRPFEDIQFGYSVNGKPFMENDNVYFNVAHTDGTFVIALNSVESIGIDIELKSRKFEFSKLKSMLFSESEQETFNKLEKKDKNEVFLKYWTRKESFFKAKGSGLSSPLKGLEFRIAKTCPPEIINIEWDPLEGKEWTVRDINISEEIVGAFAVKSDDVTEVIKKIAKFESAHDMGAEAL